MSEAGRTADAEAGESIYRSVLGRGVIYTFATIAPFLSALLVTPFVTRALGPAEYGSAAVGITLYQFAGALFALGLPMAVTRFAIVEQSGPKGARGLVLFGAAAAFVLGGAGALTVHWWGAGLFPGDAISGAPAPLLSAAGLAVVTLVQGYQRAMNRAVQFVVLAFATSFSGPPLGLLTTVILGPSAAHYLWGVAIGQVLVGIGALLVVAVAGKPALTRQEARRALAMSVPTLPHQLATTLLTMALVIIARLLLGDVQAGAVQLALFIGTAPMVVLSAFNTAWAPMVYRAPDASRAEQLTDTTRLVACVVLVLISGLIAVAPFLAIVVAGPVADTPGFLACALIAAIGVTFMTVYLSNIHLVFYSGRTGLLGVTTPVSLALSLAATVALVATDADAGPQRVAIGIVLFYALQAAASYLLRRRSGQRSQRLLPSTPWLASGVALLVIWIALSPPWWAGIVVFLVVATAVAALELIRIKRDRGRRDH